MSRNQHSQHTDDRAQKLFEDYRQAMREYDVLTTTDELKTATEQSIGEAQARVELRRELWLNALRYEAERKTKVMA